MAQLDKFIKVLHERGAQALALAAGEPISLALDGKTLPLSRVALEGPQVLGLMKEIAPADVVAEVSGGGSRAFSYASPTGTVGVDVGSNGAGLRIVVRPEGADGGGAGQDGAASPGAAQAAAPRAKPADPAGASARLDALLTRLTEVGGSDLHLRVGQPPIFRKDGSLVRQQEPACTAADIEGMLHGIMPDRDRAEHDETGDADFAYEIEGVARFRVNAARDRGGAMAVFRVIPSEVPTCDQMAITPEVRELCYLTKGLVVVTGPTGSGKSTTLAALVDLINSEREDHILTIEDPIEFVHPSKKCLVTHRQVGLHTESFKSGLRAALREDPDIVLIGELRDLETVAIAIETAETGHLVFGTLHTTTAASTVDRIIDQFPAGQQGQIRVMLSESLRAVISQTLCRRIGGGRVAAREILLTTPAISNLIREGKTYQIPSIIQTGRKLGMITLNDALLELVDQKLIEPEEAYLRAVEKTPLVTALKARGHDVSFSGG